MARTARQRGRGRARTARLLVLLAAGLAAGPAGAGGRIYAFTDASGVTHFTNMPRDERYQPIGDLDPDRVRIRSAPQHSAPSKGDDSRRALTDCCRSTSTGCRTPADLMRPCFWPATSVRMSRWA